MKFISFFSRNIRRLLVGFINTIQKYFLFDDQVSIFIRLLLLRLIGVKTSLTSKILGDCDILGGKLTVGKNVIINRRCYFDLTGHVTIEDNIGIGHGVTFITSHHEVGPQENRAGFMEKAKYVSPRNIILKKGCWIGANVTILSGVTIGQGAIIGSNSLVAKDVEPNVMVMGIPARIIKKLELDIVEHS
jgi:maltose O-acetyltransferase